MQDSIVTELDLVIWFEQLRLAYDVAVDTSVILCSQINQTEVTILFYNLRVLPSDRCIAAQVDIVLGRTADRSLMLRELMALAVSSNQPSLYFAFD